LGAPRLVWLVAHGWYWFVLREKYCWLVVGGWFVLREKYCWLVAGGWFFLREKYCWLVADKPSEQACGVVWMPLKVSGAMLVPPLLEFVAAGLENLMPTGLAQRELFSECCLEWATSQAGHLSTCVAAPALAPGWPRAAQARCVSRTARVRRTAANRR
jgi:hypothetical protein